MTSSSLRHHYTRAFKTLWGDIWTVRSLKSQLRGNERLSVKQLHLVNRFDSETIKLLNMVPFILLPGTYIILPIFLSRWPQIFPRVILTPNQLAYVDKLDEANREAARAVVVKSIEETVDDILERGQHEELSLDCVKALCGLYAVPSWGPREWLQARLISRVQFLALEGEAVVEELEQLEESDVAVSCILRGLNGRSKEALLEHIRLAKAISTESFLPTLLPFTSVLKKL